MRYLRHMVLSAICAVVPLLVLENVAAAQTRSQDKAYLKAGIKSLSAGKATSAIDQFSKAISSGNLSDKDMATALMQRGVAYRQSEKNGLAIADLTNALYLKTLTDKQREQAYLERARAFSSLGMQAQSSADIKSAGGIAATLPGAGAAATATIAKPVVAKPTNVKTAAIQKPVAPKNPVANPVVTSRPTTKPIAAPTTISPAQPTTVAAPVAPQVAPAQSPAPVQPAPPQQPQSSSFDPIKSVTDFFENLIPDSGPTQQQPAGQPVQQVAVGTEQRPVWMADPNVTTPQPVPEVPVTPATNNAQQGVQIVEGWGNSTRVAVNPNTPQRTTKPQNWPTTSKATNSDIVGRVVPAKPKIVKAAPKPKRQQVAALKPKTGKRFHLQLAQAGTQEEANQIWRSLSSSHPNLLAGLTPNVVSTQGQNGRGQYAVGLGPFSSKNSTEKICRTFQQQGLPCSVVKR